MSYLRGTEEDAAIATAINTGAGIAAQTFQSLITGKYATRYDPKSGLPLDPGTGAVMDPATGWPASPEVIKAATNAKLMSGTGGILGTVIVLALAAAVISQLGK